MERCSIWVRGVERLRFEACPTFAILVAIDVNPRALAFTEFNAALNGITNLTILNGDRFEAVTDRRFDLIICNPPFFLNPQARLLYTDNPGELDSFVETLIRTGPGFLKPGGLLPIAL